MSDIVYLTGASGFVGQMIVQQCESNPSISKIYCPIRGKKQSSGAQRFEVQFGAYKKAAFIEPDIPVPRDVTLVLLNAYSVKFFTPVEDIVSESIKPMMDILDQISQDREAGVSRVRGISVVSTAYVQPPLPYTRSANNRVPFLLEGTCSASDLYRDLRERSLSWEEVITKHSDKLLPYQKKNCYSSSKNLMEHLVFERYPSLPICIVRPSIVAPSKDGTYGYTSRAGFPLFVNIAPHSIMMAPASEGRLNLVFVDDVATDIVRAAQELATPAADGIHPILLSASLNEDTPMECFQKLAPHIRRVHLQNSTLRAIVRAIEILIVLVLFGKKKAKLVKTLYQNYDMIMSREFDFQENHGPCVDEAVRGAHIYYRQRMAPKEKGNKKASSEYHALCFGTLATLAGFVVSSFAPTGLQSIAAAFVIILIFGFKTLANESGLSASARFLRLFTPLFDYFLVSVAFLLFNRTCRADALHDLVKLGLIAAGTQSLAVLRDGSYLHMFPTVIAKDKVDFIPGWKELRAAVKTWGAAMLLLSLLNITGYAPLQPITSLQSVLIVLLELAGNLVTTDYPFMFVFHGWMHRCAWAFRYLHKDHHEPRKSCQAFDAFKFSVPDLFVENGLAPFVFLGIKAALGMPVTVHMASLVLLAYQQINEHSANPHSPIFLNPILDHIFKINIKHQLHHACCASDDDVVIPMSHLWSSKRRKEMLHYQKVFGVDLGYDLPTTNDAAVSMKRAPQ